MQTKLDQYQDQIFARRMLDEDFDDCDLFTGVGEPMKGEALLKRNGEIWLWYNDTWQFTVADRNPVMAARAKADFVSHKTIELLNGLSAYWPPWKG